MFEERVARAKWLLQNVKHAAMATVNADGTPHNTPYFFMRSSDLSELYWGSSPKSLHSQNIERTRQIFVVLYEANEGGGLYIQCKNARVAVAAELERALAVRNKLRRSFDKDPIPPDYYLGNSGQKMYIADTEKFWVNYSERDGEGRVIEDKRKEVTANELLAI